MCVCDGFDQTHTHTTTHTHTNTHTHFCRPGGTVTNNPDTHTNTIKHSDLLNLLRVLVVLSRECNLLVKKAMELLEGLSRTVVVECFFGRKKENQSSATIALLELCPKARR